MTINPKRREPSDHQLAFVVPPSTLPSSLSDERTRRAAIHAAVSLAALGSLGEEPAVESPRAWSAVDAARHRVVVEARRADSVRHVLERRAPPKISRGRRHFGAAPLLAVGSSH
mgnify:FL=1